MAGYAPGKYHLSGNKALAFARNRTGSDDFFRMKQGQFILKAALKQLKFTNTMVPVASSDRRSRPRN